MSADLGELLTNYDLKDLYYAYQEAYLKKYPRKDFGEYGEGRVIRTEDNSAFTLVNCPEITDNQAAIDKQAVSSNLQEQFLSMIAFLMLKKHRDLPCDKLKVALCINHHNIHWTTLLAEISGFDNAEYRRLFQAHEAHAALPENRDNYVDEEGHPKEFKIQLNNIKNFLISQSRMTLNNNKNGKTILGNYSLPLTPRHVLLRHLDSMGIKTACADNVLEASKGFMRKHRARFRYEKCSRQEGNTCGDWSLFNAFSRGVLQNVNEVTSENLRELKENITLNNARSILFMSNPNIVTVADSQKLSVTRLERMIANNPSTDTYNINFFKEWFVRIASGATLAGVSYFVLPLLLPINASFALGLAAVGGTMGLFFFNEVSSVLFGISKLRVRLDEQGIPAKDGYELSEGWVGSPYLRTLPELEQQVATVLLEADLKKSKSKRRLEGSQEKVQTLVHYYARKIVLENPKDFYDADKMKVISSDYVDDKQANKALCAP
ncbi:MAG: hypothetical protein AB7I18_03690 [Candidatus Berkiella sp.]